MPVLPLEPVVFPDSLFDPNVAPNRGEWWVLHTRPRAEKAVARTLHQREVGFFLPIQASPVRPAKSKSTRTRVSQLPLFPGYVFLHGDSEARQTALKTNLLVQTLPVHDQARLRQDLERVYRLLTSEMEVKPETKLTPGTEIEVIAGPLEGMTGTVLRRGRQLHLIVEVEFLQRGISVEIESWMIQARSSEFGVRS